MGYFPLEMSISALQSVLSPVTFENKHTMDKIKLLKLEMYGEIAWAHWSEGKFTKAFLKMYKVVLGLIEELNFDDPGFREIYMKTGLVLGWMHSMLITGKPPGYNIGQEYAEPFPGLFSQPSRLLASQPMPPFNILLYSLGIIAEQCKYYDIAWDFYNKAIAHNPKNSTRYLIELSLASVAARKENYEESLKYAINGFKAQAVASYCRSIGFGSIDQDVSYEEIVDKIPPDKIPDSKPWIYWYTVGPAIIRWLSLNGDGYTLHQVLNELERIFRSNPQINNNYWLDTLNDIRVFFNPQSSAELIPLSLSKNKNEYNITIYHYLSLAMKPTTPIKVKLKCHLYTFSFLAKGLPYTEIIMEYLYAYFYNFWKEIAFNQSYLLSGPQLIKNAINSIQLPNLVNISELILLLINSLGLVVEADIIEQLRKIQSRE